MEYIEVATGCIQTHPMALQHAKSALYDAAHMGMDAVIAHLLRGFRVHVWCHQPSAHIPGHLNNITF